MSKPRNKWRPAIARHSHRTAQLPIATCPDCGKRAYTSKGSAKNSARVLYPGQRMRVYQCGPWWHRHVTGRGESCRVQGQAAGPGGPE